MGVSPNFCNKISHKLTLKTVLCSKYISMAASELLAEFGLRLDGRKAEELRNIKCRLGVFGQADGSAYLEQGATKVLAAVYGPREPRQRGGAETSEVKVNCQYSMAVFSTSERKKRPRGDLVAAAAVVVVVVVVVV